MENGTWDTAKGSQNHYAYGIDQCRVNVGNGPQLDFPVAY